VFEIGSSLREARIRQGYDLAEAEIGTKIRSKYLDALEEERFDVLPAPTYVKGFLRSYADFLGLDGQLYVDEFTTRYGSGEEEYLPSRTYRSSARRPSPAHRRFESRVLALALVGIVLAASLVFAAWKWGGAEPTVSGLGTRQPESSGSTGAAAGKPKKHAPVNLLLVARRGNSQLQVMRGSANGEILFQGTLERGRMMRFAGRKLWLNVASPENLAARLNGKAVRISTERRPVTVVVTKGGVARAPS
jgi:helix-turn-helix protein